MNINDILKCHGFFIDGGDAATVDGIVVSNTNNTGSLWTSDKVIDYVNNGNSGFTTKLNQTLNTLTPSVTFNSPAYSPVNVKIPGKLAINLLGHDGDCGDLSKWVANVASATVDSANKVFGANGFKVTLSSTTGGLYKSNIWPASAALQIDVTKYYLYSAYLKNGTATQIALLKDDVGGGAVITSAIVTDTTKFTRVAVKLKPADLNVGNAFYAIFLSGTTGQYAYADGVMINEITAAEYTALTTDQLMAKYPYVSGVQPLRNPVVTIAGKNLFDECALADNLGAGGTAQITKNADGTYLFRQTTTVASGTGNTTIPVKSGTQYTLKASNVLFSAGSSLQFFYNEILADGTLLYPVTPPSITIDASMTAVTFTTSAKTVAIATSLQSVSGTTITTANFNLQLEEGAVATAYEPHKKTYRAYQTQLAAIPGTTYADTLVDSGGKASVNRVCSKLALDSGYTYSATDATGFKVIQTQLVPANNLSNQINIAIKYSGKLLGWYPGTSADHAWIGGDGILYLTAADTDTGWTEAMTPTTDEIKAYFLGWKMCASDGSTYVSSTKYWKKILDGTGITSTLPTASYTGWNYYQIWYAVDKPTIEDVMAYGDVLETPQGACSISINSGVVFEKITPNLNQAGTAYTFNALAVSAYPVNSLLKLPPAAINKVLRNISINDTAKWTIAAGGDTTQWQNGIQAYITTALFDPASDYYALYKAANETCNNAQVEASIDYCSNLLDGVQTASKTIAELSKQVSSLILSRAIMSTSGPLSIYVDQATGSDNNDGLTPGTAFKTIGLAIRFAESLGRINHVVKIYVAPGTYAEDIKLQALSGKESLSLYGNSAAVADTHNVNSIFLQNNTIPVIIVGFALLTASTYSILAINSLHTHINLCKAVTAAGSFAGYVCVAGMMYVQNSVVSNKNIGMFANLGARVISENNTGSDNYTNLYCGNSIIQKVGSQPTATNQTDYIDPNYGGQIINKDGTPGGAVGSSMMGAGTPLPATTGTMTVTMDGSLKAIIPTGACTFNATGGYKGQTCSFEIVTTVSTSYILTFGANFRTTGPLATGTSASKIFEISFVCDGQTWFETGRTVAM